MVPNLFKRGRTFYYVRNIPADLQEHYKTKQVRLSLKTADRSEAKRLCLLQTFQHDEEFDRLRKIVPCDADLSNAYLNDLAQAWADEWIRDDERRRIAGQMKLEGEIYLGPISISIQAAGHLLANEARLGSYSISAELAKQWLNKQKVTIDCDGERFRYFCSRLIGAAQRAMKTLSARCQGEVVDSPEKVLVAPSRQVGATLGDLIEPWILVNKPRSDAVGAWKLAVHRFEALHGRLLLDQISRTSVVEFRDDLLKQGLAASTVESKYLAAIRSLLSVAVDRGMISDNPAHGVKPPKAGMKERVERAAFTVPELMTIFTSPVYRDGVREAGGRGEAQFWIPLIALFSGAREEEICQLLIKDVCSEDGITYFYFRNDGEQQSLKNPGSKRKVPIHPELVRIGFMQYVESVQSHSSGQLFPQLTQGAKGKFSASWSKWFGRYLDRIGIDDPSKVFHSFRHTFKRFSRMCGIPEDRHDALTGHRNGSTARDYGGDYPLRPLAEAISSYKVEGLDLSHLYRG